VGRRGRVPATWSPEETHDPAQNVPPSGPLQKNAGYWYQKTTSKYPAPHFSPGAYLLWVRPGQTPSSTGPHRSLTPRFRALADLFTEVGAQEGACTKAWPFSYEEIEP